MDKETLSNYGWIVICVLVLAVMIALATPFGSFVSGAVQNTTQGLFDVNQSALNSTGLISIDDQEFDTPGTTKVEVGTNIATAIADAPDGEVLVMQEDINIAQLKIEKNVIIDLNGHTLTTSNNYGGLLLKNGSGIKNGTIVHNGNTAAIKAYTGCTIEDLTINVTPGATNKVVTGIAVQAGANVNAIKNVTVNGASQGIEVGYQSHVGVIQSANVNASTNGTANGVALIINGGRVDSVVGCELNGDAYGVNVYLKGVYDVGVTLVNSKVSGETGLWAHDEVGIANAHCGTLTVTYDAASTITGGINWDVEDECAEIAKLNAPN